MLLAEQIANPRSVRRCAAFFNQIDMVPDADMALAADGAELIRPDFYLGIRPDAGTRSSLHALRDAINQRNPA